MIQNLVLLSFHSFFLLFLFLFHCFTVLGQESARNMSVLCAVMSRHSYVLHADQYDSQMMQYVFQKLEAFTHSFQTKLEFISVKFWWEKNTREPAEPTKKVTLFGRTKTTNKLDPHIYLYFLYCSPLVLRWNCSNLPWPLLGQPWTSTMRMNWMLKSATNWRGKNTSC